MRQNEKMDNQDIIHSIALELTTLSDILSFSSTCTLAYKSVWNNKTWWSIICNLRYNDTPDTSKTLHDVIDHYVMQVTQHGGVDFHSDKFINPYAASIRVAKMKNENIINYYSDLGLINGIVHGAVLLGDAELLLRLDRMVEPDLVYSMLVACERRELAETIFEKKRWRYITRNLYAYG